MLEAVGPTIAGIALVVSVIVFIDNRLRAVEAARLARVPMLAFTWDALRQSWILTNIGSGPALDVVILQRIGGQWASPLRMPEMAVQDSNSVPISWVRWKENPGLGARYRSITGEQYMTKTGDDWSQHSPGWGDIPATLWNEIEPHWRYRDDEPVSVRDSSERRPEKAERQTGGPQDQSGAHRFFMLGYRRADAAGDAERLHDQLERRFGNRQVFMGHDTIRPGAELAEQIERAVGAADALIVVIGRDWLHATDATGRRRLDDPGDVVRLQIERALHQGIRVIPVLVQGARMPSAEELPASLAALASLQALEISEPRWDFDVERLAASLSRRFAER
jgi:TIR domain